MVNFTLGVFYHHHHNKNNDQKPKVILPKLWKWQVIFIYDTSFTIIQNSAAKSTKCWMGHFRSGICAALETAWRPAPAWNPWSEQTMATGLAATPFLIPNLIPPQDHGSGGGAWAWTTEVQRGLSELLGNTSCALQNQPTCNLKRSVLFLHPSRTLDARLCMRKFVFSRFLEFQFMSML